MTPAPHSAYSASPANLAPAWAFSAQTQANEAAMLRAIGWIFLIIFLIGLAVVIGVFDLLF